MNDTTTTPTPQAPAPAPQPRRITRPREDRILAGVASGVARHLDVDPWVIRIIALVLVPFGGLGVLLYLAGWALIPEEDAPESLAESWIDGLKGSTTWIGVALIAVAAIWIAAVTNIVSAGLAWAVVLLALGILLYTGRLPEFPRHGDAEPPSASAPDVVAEEGADAAEDAPEAAEVMETITATGVVPDTATGDLTEFADPAIATPPRERRPRRRRARAVLLRLTLGTMLVVLGVMALLDVSGAISPDLRHYLVAAVLVVGLGLIVGSVFGRSRALIVIGLLLTPPLLAAAAVTAPFTGGWGDPVYRPLDASEVQSAYRLAGGEMQIDLRSLSLEDGSVVDVVASVGAGRLLVFVPAGAGLDLSGHVGFGSIRVLGSEENGVDVDRSYATSGTGTFDLDLDVGFGQVEIVRAGSPVN